MCQVAVSQFAVYEIPSRMFKEHFFLSDILKLRFFFPLRFKGCLVAPRRCSCSSASVTCQRDGCLAFTNTDHSLALERDAEVYRNAEFDTAGDVRRDWL